ncbi:MAG: hypothetical protein ACK4F7_00875 [Inhella sp.]
MPIHAMSAAFSMFPRLLICAALTVLPATPALAQELPASCGSLANGENGPFDYRVVRGHRLKVVEEFHFNTKVEALISGQSGTIGADLDYVLRAFPNHHRALSSMSRLARRLGLGIPPGANYTPECYFMRALHWRTDDTTARMLYAQFLHEFKRSDEAVWHLERTAEHARDNGFTHHNIALIYADMKRYDRARDHGRRALQLGFRRQGLIDSLRNAGHWDDADELIPTDAPASGSGNGSTLGSTP